MAENYRQLFHFLFDISCIIPQYSNMLTVNVPMTARVVFGGDAEETHLLGSKLPLLGQWRRGI